MGECIDKEIGKLLHAYELGQLNDQEIELFEEHLMECNYCYDEARKSQNISRLILTDEENKKNIVKIVSEKDGTEKIIDIKSKSKWSGIFKIAVAVAAVVVILVLNPWKIEFSPKQEAVAHDNMLAIMYFDNLASGQDQNRMGEIIADLLITDLAESGYFTIVSEQKIYDLLKQMGHEGLKKVNKSLASQIARKSNAKYMLTGSLIQVEPYIVITSQLIDVESGNVIASQKVTGNRGELIFPIIDELSFDIMHDLSFPDEALAKDQAICNITSCSIEAYQYYIEGMDYFYKFDYNNADSLFREAISVDTTFAMAYYRLAMSTGDRKTLNWAIDNAVAYMSNSNQIQQKYITAYNLSLQKKYNQAFGKYTEIIEIAPNEKEAYYRLALIHEARREWEPALEMLNKTIEIDPFFKIAYRRLAYIYERFEDYDQSIRAINQYIDMSPNEWVPLNTRGNLYTFSGDFAKAKSSYRAALAIKPDFTAAINNIAFIAIFERDYKTCDSMLEIFKSDPIYKNSEMASNYQIYILNSKGKITESLKLYDNNSAWSCLIKCSLYDRFTGDYEKALASARRADSIGMSIDPKSTEIMNMKGALAIALELNNRRRSADSVMGEIFDFYNNSELRQFERYSYFRGIVERIRGNYDSAIYYHEIAAEVFPRFAEYHELALSYFEGGRYDEAIPAFEKTIRQFGMDRIIHLPFGIVSHYYLGIAYKREGYKELALEQLQLFKEIWKDADPVVKQRYDADKELKELISM